MSLADGLATSSTAPSGCGERSLRRVLVGFDGSADAAAAIQYGALLLPDARATIAHMWMPPLAAHPSAELLRRAGTVDGLIELLNEQGRLRSEEVTHAGVAVAFAAGRLGR
jgi:hypothetical protein